MDKQQTTVKWNTLAMAMIFLCLALFTFNKGGFGQSSRTVENQVDQLMGAVRSGDTKPDIQALYGTDKLLSSLLVASSRHLSDSLLTIRLEAYKITYTVALKAEKPTLKQRAVEILSGALLDQDGSINGWGARHMSVFKREDYTEPAKFNIVKGIQNQIPKKSELIRIAGYLNLVEAEGIIKQEAELGKRTSDRWAAYLALARMGDESYANKVVNAVRRQGLNDDAIYELVPDLIYTRQRVCIDYAIEILYEDKKQCSSANPDNPSRIVCGYRVMEYLAPVIQDFPFKVRTSGDIDTDDYPHALNVSREWFLEKGNSYTIIDDSF